MANRREPRQVARRALVLSTVAFRGSLEVTAHPRVDEAARRLLPWLAQIGCDGEVDPIEREQLATTLGQLSESQMVDLRWAGESAALFCWMLGLGVAPDPMRPTDATDLPTYRCVLRPEALALVERAALRTDEEVESACRRYVVCLSLLRESRVPPPVAAVIRRACVTELAEVGHPLTADDLDHVSDFVASLRSEDRATIAGLYAVRRHAAMWYLRGRGGYFSDEAGTDDADN